MLKQKRREAQSDCKSAREEEEIMKQSEEEDEQEELLCFTRAINRSSLD